jgi:hypothetical protein
MAAVKTVRCFVGPASGFKLADANCALRVMQGAGQEMGHRTPGNGRSIAHEILGAGSARAAGKTAAW